MDELYNHLHNLGFSKYECKTYIGLLKHSSVTGYEISKKTGVPRSMIYEVLGKLIEKGAVYQIPSDPIKYTPVPAKDLMNRLRKHFAESFDFLEEKLDELESERDVDVIWHIRNGNHVYQEMTDMIQKTEKELWLSIWEPQILAIKGEVDKLVEKGIDVFSVLFGASHIELGTTFHHNYMAPEVVKQRMGGYLTIITRDSKEVLIANFTNDRSGWAVKTHDPALVLVAEEYIKHDIVIEKITEEFGQDRLDRLWRSNPDLVRVVTGKRFNT
ncbi:TrmB family transcriptional regulator [Pontibacillus litoralis]|uniref:Transcriptional regulator n=1 Tax=Pontibacillus litoralis JSM 072002 TaxID=1385512 RepID=A0A0A5FZK1_9BACI|nr:helix-turn-helix domain-containing protein [Pontibacillus litoralis]KGX84250.1 transcriptional regulator [Pontibacillus litoralis JSM 072002]